MKDKTVQYNQAVYYYERVVYERESDLKDLYLEEAYIAFSALHDKYPTDWDVMSNMVIVLAQQLDRPSAISGQYIFKQAMDLVDKLKGVGYPKAYDLEKMLNSTPGARPFLTMEPRYAGKGAKSAAACCILF